MLVRSPKPIVRLDGTAVRVRLDRIHRADPKPEVFVHGLRNSSCGSWISAFRIKRAIRCFDTLEALGGFRNRPSNREIIGLAFDYEPVSPGRKYKIGILWPDHQHLGAFAQRRYSELI